MIDRSRTPDNPLNTAVVNTEHLLGTGVVEPILASGYLNRPATGRTYDRKRSDQT